MMSLSILGIDNILFAVGDLTQARVFYETQLGLPVKFVVAEAGLIAYRLGEEEAGLLLRVQDIEPTAPRATPRVWLEVADARAAAQQLEALGVILLKEPWEVSTGWVVEIADPWGNVIGLTDYLKAPQKARKYI
ncbi:MAG: VOC family protein [Chloroflexota bacterium]|nr:VOC family protein [Chloroflexota bacterium]